jgi:hypothetical protein
MNEKKREINLKTHISNEFKIDNDSLKSASENKAPNHISNINAKNHVFNLFKNQFLKTKKVTLIIDSEWDSVNQTLTLQAMIKEAPEKGISIYYSNKYSKILRLLNLY